MIFNKYPPAKPEVFRLLAPQGTKDKNRQAHSQLADDDAFGKRPGVVRKGVLDDGITDQCRRAERRDDT